MANGLPDLLARIRIDTSEVEKVGAKLKDSVGKAVGQASSQIEGFGSRIQKAMVPAGAALAGIGTGLTALSRPAERAERVLKQTIENSGQSYAKFDEQIDRTIKAQERFGNNSAEVQTALTNLTLKLKDPQKALDNLSLTTDVAALKQISLADASNLVASALNGNARAFKQFGITLDSSKPKAEAVAEAVEKLRTAVRGFAEGDADSFEGRIEGWRTRLENFGAEIGKRAGPAIAGLGAALATVGGAADGLESVSNLLDKLPGKTEGVAKAVGGIGLGAAGVFVAVKALGALDEAIETARRGSQNLGAVSAAFVELSKGARNLNDVLSAGRLKGGVDSVIADLERFRQSVGTFDEQTLAAGLKHNLDDLDKGLADLVAGGHAQQAADAFRVLNAALNLTPKEQAQFFNDYASAVEAAGNKAIVSAAQTDVNTSALDRNAEALKRVTEQVNIQLAAQLAAISSSLGFEAATDRVSDSQREVAEKTAAVTAAIKDHGAKSVEATAAQEDLSDAERGLRDAAVGAASAAVRLAEDQAKAKNASFDAATANAVFKTKLQELASQIGGPTGDALRALADTIKAVPGQKDVQFQMLGLENSIRNVERLNVAIDRAAARGTSVKPRLGQFVPDARAAGGPVSGGQAYIVGEKRPELFIPNTDGWILPRVPKVPALVGQVTSSAASGGDTINLTVNLPNYLGSKDEIVRVLVPGISQALDSRRRGHS